MRGAVAVMAILLSLAGCAEPGAEPQPLNALPPPPVVPAATVGYRCPGEDSTAKPCGIPTDALGLFGVLDLSVREDGVAFAVGTSPASGVGTLAGQPDPGFAVAVSQDQGQTWTSYLLPTVATDSTRTGTATASFATISATSEAIVVLATLSPDPERRIVGGEVIPEPVQPRHDVAVFISRDEARTWAVDLLATGGATYWAQVRPWPGGGFVASWWDALLDAQVVQGTRDLMSWGPALVLPDCEIASFAWAGNTTIAACISDPDGFDVGSVQVVSASVEQGVVNGEALLPDGMPDCTHADLEPTHDGLLLIASGCPGLEFLASTDGLAWTRQAWTPFEALGIEAVEMNGAVGVTLDDQGRVHALLRWAGTSAFCCTDEVNDHLVVDPWTGAVHHHITLSSSSVGADAEGLVGLVRQVMAYTEGEVHWSSGTGWLVWPGNPARVGLFSMGDA